MHRDLSLQNIWINEKGYLELQLSDSMKILNKERLYTIVGTREFIAPEVFLGKGKLTYLSILGYAYEADIYSLGVVLYMLVVGQLPLNNNEINDP
jgi:protein kinase A